MLLFNTPRGILKKKHKRICKSNGIVNSLEKQIMSSSKFCQAKKLTQKEKHEKLYKAC